MADSFDCRKYGALTRMVPNRVGNTAWAHVVVETVRGLLEMRGVHDAFPSAQELIICCCFKRGYKKTIKGGLKYIVDNCISTIDHFPLTSAYCKRCDENIDAEVAITGFRQISVITVESLKEVLRDQKQPVALSIICGPEYHAYPRSKNPSRKKDVHEHGIYPLVNKSLKIDYHCVVLVGFGGEGDAAYWTLRESKGEEWGDKGYARVSQKLTEYFRLAAYPYGAYKIQN